MQLLLGFLIQLMFGGLNYSLVDPLFNVNRLVKQSGKYEIVYCQRLSGNSTL